MTEEAVIKMGLSLSVFLNMTLYEYRLHIEHFLFSKSKEWEHTRQICYMIYIALTPVNERIDIFEFMPLSIDPIKEPEKEADPAEIERIRQLAIERMQILQNIL